MDGLEKKDESRDDGWIREKGRKEGRKEGWMREEG